MKSLRVLLDECIDSRLAREITTHKVRTVYQEGWSGLKNGALLAVAQQKFDVFITVDRNLTSQQNLKLFDIAVIVLRSASNNLKNLRRLVPAIMAALPEVSSHSVTVIDE